MSVQCTFRGSFCKETCKFWKFTNVILALFDSSTRQYYLQLLLIALQFIMLIPCYFIINDENPRTFLKFTRRNLYCLNIIRGLLSDWAKRCIQSVIMYSVSVLSKLIIAIWWPAVNIFKALLSLVSISESYCPLHKWDYY